MTRGCSEDPNQDIGFSESAYGWAAGRTLAEVLEGSDLTAGDFVRWVRQVADFAGQIADAAGPGDLRDTARLLVRSMRRGVVSYAPEMDADEGDDLPPPLPPPYYLTYFPLYPYIPTPTTKPYNYHFINYSSFFFSPSTPRNPPLSYPPPPSMFFRLHHNRVSPRRQTIVGVAVSWPQERPSLLHHPDQGLSNQNTRLVAPASVLLPVTLGQPGPICDDHQSRNMILPVPPATWLLC